VHKIVYTYSLFKPHVLLLNRTQLTH